MFIDSEKQFDINGVAMQKSNIDYTLSEQQYIQIDNPSNDFELYSRIH